MWHGSPHVSGCSWLTVISKSIFTALTRHLKILAASPGAVAKPERCNWLGTYPSALYVIGFFFYVYQNLI